jgi:hypothetical protein
VRGLAIFLGVLVAGCGAPEAPTSSTESAVIGQCVRNEATLRGPAIECTIDAGCPCGSFCDTVEHTCRFQCMVPPGSQAESCATGTQCDDTGRCVAPGQQPPSQAPTLTAFPAAVTTVPGAEAQSLQVRLAAATPSAATAAQTTAVRAIGDDGAEVSCDAVTFGHECALASWSFAFDGTRYNASRSLWVRTPGGTPLGRGELHLRIDQTTTDVVVPASAAAAPSAGDGDYRGTVSRFGVAAPLPITAKVRGNFLVLRDPTRTLAPEGTVVTRIPVSGQPAPPAWRALWLRPPGVTTGGALYGDYGPVLLQASPSTGVVTATFSHQVLGGFTTWRLNMSRTEPVAECTTTADCQGGQICPNEIRTCVPPDAWNSGPSVANQLDDPRSAQWWNAMRDALGTGDVATGLANPAFASTGADFIESLMCSTSAGTGYLGANQIMSGTGPSHSGDLACVNESAQQNQSPGAVGLTTRFDRKGSAASLGLLNTCLQDLARPVTSDFTANFGVNTGDCVNLARMLPALRLLGTGELAKRTSVILNPFRPDLRLMDLMHRLLQQWGHLHGFIASTGLSERGFEDATTSTPAAARQGLLALLDVLDAGWTALLDQRVEPAVENATGSEDGSDLDLFQPQNDYRLVKKPVAYWTFNTGANANRDIIQSVPLFTQKPPCITITCTPPPDTCLILNSRNSVLQAWSCPGFTAQLPATSPSISDGGNLSVVFNVDPLDAEVAPYSGGTILATATLAVVETWANGQPTLNIIHPTGPGTTEWVPFHVGALGHWTGGTTGGDGPPAGTSVAVVRDIATQTYTVYVWNTSTVNGLQVFTQQYQSVVQDRLDRIGSQQVLVGAGPWQALGRTWWSTGTPQLRSSYAAKIDDVAIFNSMLSKREFVRFASRRGYVETHRDLWLTDMVLADYGTQDLASPVGTDLLDALIAHLELADRLAVHMRYEAQAACDSQDPAARADLDAIVARLGRTLRQSLAVQGMLSHADSDSANKERGLLGVKTSQLTRDLVTLVECHNPYGLTDTEVPLYFGSIAPATDEKAAFFAASDHLLALAEQRSQSAQTALDTVRLRWDQARQSQIQQLQDDTTRAIRVDELKTKYGDGLIRLCGISDRTPDAILQDVSAGTFSVDTCFIKPPGANNSCPTQSTSGPVMDADPTCYRGAIGGALMDIRAAFHAQQAAYQSWQAAIANAEAAERLCVLKEMDVFGCSALDRHALTGVTCPPGHAGTLDLIDRFNHEMIEAESEKSWFDAVVHTISTVGAVVVAAAASGPGAAFLAAVPGVLSPVSTEMGNSMEDRKRAHEATLQKRALIDEVRTCWNQADQYDRAIAASEQASQEATSRMQSAIITFENGVAEAREILTEAPVVIDRELSRPSIPIAFHYWLPEALETFHVTFETARRYAYMALRATEYDTLDHYAVAQVGKPSRSAVLGAWLPPTLTQQLSLMRDQTNTRQTVSGPPKLGHLTFDLGAKFFGLTESSPDFGAALTSYVRPVYSQLGEYLGLGVRFSLVPEAADESPTWRCAERIWRVNLGASGLPSSGDGVHVKLLKRNVFASRQCHADGFQVASLRPGTNLLVAAGDAPSYVAENTSSAADVSLMDFNQPDALFNFKTRDDFLNGSSSELSLQELYGDYVLLFPATVLNAGLVLDQLRDFYLRFDFLSIDNTPPIQALKLTPVARVPRTPIVVP